MEDFLQRLAEELAPRIKAELEKTSAWVDQKGSPLGRNRHCAAVKRRMAEGLEGAYVAPGNRCMLTPAALREEMQRTMTPAMPGLAKTTAPEATQPAGDPEERAAFERVMANARRVRGR